MSNNLNFQIMKNEGTIKRVQRVETRRYTHGTNYVKGDFIPTMVF